MKKDLYSALLSGWPRLILAGILGAVLGWGVGSIMPKTFRAQAVIVVDYNVDRLLPEEVAAEEVESFVNGNALRLEAIAYSDGVWSEVETALAEAGWDLSRRDRDSLLGSVTLPHPEDGAWTFDASDPTPEFAANLANAWAAAFVMHAKDATAAARTAAGFEQLVSRISDSIAEQEARCTQLVARAAEAEKLRSELTDGAVEEPADLTALRSALEALQLESLLEQSPGSTPQTAAEAQQFLQEVESGLRLAGEACQASTEVLRAEWQEALADLESSRQASFGLPDVLEAEIVREATVPDEPYHRPGWFVLAGAGLGWLAGGLSLWDQTRKQAGVEPGAR